MHLQTTETVRELSKINYESLRGFLPVAIPKQMGEIASLGIRRGGQSRNDLKFNITAPDIYSTHLQNNLPMPGYSTCLLSALPLFSYPPEK